MKNSEENQRREINEHKREMRRYFDSIINVEKNEERQEFYRKIRDRYDALEITSNIDAIKLDKKIGSVLELFRQKESFDESNDGIESDNQRFEVIKDWLNQFIARREKMIDEFNFALDRKEEKKEKWKAKIDQQYEMKFWELDKDTAELKLGEVEIKFQRDKLIKEKNRLLEAISENQDNQGLRIEFARVNNRIKSNNTRFLNNSRKIDKAEELKTIIEENMDDDKYKKSFVNKKEAKRDYEQRYDGVSKQIKEYETMDLYNDAYMKKVNTDMNMNYQMDANEEEIQTYINQKNERQRNNIINNFDGNQNSNNQIKNKKEGE